jgi:ribosomal protein S18 acetylase RimI-like enzyme
MIDLELLTRLTIEPLDRQKHDRAAFSCGVATIDNYIAKSAAKHQDENVTRVRVACLDATPIIAGFYALNSHAIDVTSLPEPERKRLPHYPTTPAVYLSMIAVHQEFQGHGVGQYLLADALKRVEKVAEEIGTRFIVLDALNEGAAKLYARIGFVALPSAPGRMILNIARIGKANVKASQTP